jgi:uncharacterized repeat protein (TIGR02543 family)
MKRKNFFRFGLVLSIAAILVLLFNGCYDDQPTEKVEKTTFTVSFDLNTTSGVIGATGAPAAITNVAKGAMISKPEADPTSTSHNFAGWYKETACAATWDFGTDTVTANITLYAKWSEKTPLSINEFVYFWDSELNEIVITGSETTLTYGQSATITGPGTADYTGWVWRVNGIVDTSSTDAAFTFDSLGRSPGFYNINLLVEYQNQWYSAAITIVIQGGE